MMHIKSLSERLEALEYIGVGLLVVLLIGALGLAQPLRAAEFTCASGNVACLIDAINQANANGQANRINLRRGTYTLTAVDNDENGLPIITSPLTITGREAETTIIERHTSAPPFRILNVAAAGTLTLQGLTLRNSGGGLISGGGINNSGNLSLIDCILTGNSGAGLGGGLFNSGTVTITNSSIDHNGAVVGGGIYNREGTVTIAKSSIVKNNGLKGVAGILNESIMSLTNTTVAMNGPPSIGPGGIDNFGTLILQNTTVAGNHGGAFTGPGGIENGGRGTLIVQNTIIADNNDTPPAPPPGVPDCFGPVTSLGNNLIGDLSGCDINLLPSDLTGDPGLGNFTDNGKPGNGYFPLLSTSQAIDAGNNAVCFRRDQLGKRRVGPCDIGAIRFLDGVDRKHKEQDDHQDTAQAFR